MKKLVIVLSVIGASLFSMNTFAAENKTCDNQPVIFKAHTEKGKKEVRLCMIKGTNTVRYTFGKIGKAPDISLDRKMEDVEFGFGINGDQWVNVKNGVYKYEINEFLRHAPALYVHKNGDIIADITLIYDDFYESNLYEYREEPM